VRLLADEGGTLALTTVVLLPLVLVTLVGVLELGAVRVVAERARLAADLATVTAVNDQDDAYLARRGRLRLAPEAEDVARGSFAANLEPLAGWLASSPSAVAASADVAVFRDGGERDPRTGRRYREPTVRLTAELPVLTPAFALLLARPVTEVRILSTSSAR